MATATSNIFWGLLPIVLIFLVRIACFAGMVYALFLLVKALQKYLRSGEVCKENAAFFQSLGEALKEHRTQKGMTQEFVAEQLGVSRQAVSKWENGTSDPSTANLLALAKLYGVRPEELLGSVKSE